jgi:hypothetical protein
MVELVGVIPDWRTTLCLILDILGGELIKRGNNCLVNKLLSVMEKAFKNETSEVRVESFVAWRHFIDRLLPLNVEVRGIYLFSHPRFVYGRVLFYDRVTFWNIWL